LTGGALTGQAARQYLPPVPKPTSPQDADAGPVGQPAGLIVQIAGLLPSLTPAEQQVARLVVADPAAAAARTVTDLAATAGVSEATVIRFCRSVGVSGYPQLRLRLAAEAGRHTGPADQGDAGLPADADLSRIIAAVAFEDALAVRETAARLDPVRCGAVVDAIVGAGRVEVHGAGGSAFVAAELRRRLHRLGLVVAGWPDAPSAYASVDLLGAGDVLVALSHTGTTAQTVEVVRRARRRGARTVAVTTFPRSALGRAADLVLGTAVRETPDRRGETASRSAQLTVVDVLVLGVTRRRVTRMGD
jgi:DNA-binding MurR/RpiR family transcriptional regulator